jgi:Exodeoxyribonuclease X-like C-terminal
MADYRLTFGRYKGKTIDDIDRLEPGYLDWLVHSPYKEAAEAAKVFLSKQAATQQEPERRLAKVTHHLLTLKERPYLLSYAIAIDANVYQNESMIEVLLSNLMGGQTIMIVEEESDFPLDFVETFMIGTDKKSKKHVGRKTVANVEEEVWCVSCAGFTIHQHPLNLEEALDSIEYYLSNRWRSEK